MTEAKHVPEWEVDGDDEYDGVPFIVITETLPNGGVRGVCDVSPTLDAKADQFVLTEDDYARAHLIAAAPKMLAALRRAEQFIRNGIELGFIRMPDPETPDTAHQTPGIINDAIAKATGQQLTPWK